MEFAGQSKNPSQPSSNWLHSDPLVHQWVKHCEELVRPLFARIEENVDEGQFRVLEAFRQEQVSDIHLNGSTGYGYGDRGREILDHLYARIFGTEAALVRPHIVSGTHAIATALFGQLRRGDELIYATGAPYDTLRHTIGTDEDDEGSLREMGVHYREIPLTVEGQIDTPALVGAISPRTKVIAWQRSSGYAWRPSVSVEQLRSAFTAVKATRPDVVCFVDNCYGEFVEPFEPTHVGADLMAGSLIKNPGGGLALAGGYIVGHEDLVRRAAHRLTAPGIGGEAGATFGTNRLALQGLFLAPHVVGEALKGAIFTAALFQQVGLDTRPRFSDARTDIIQAIRFGDRERMLSYCRSIQSAAPVDSHVRPEPWAMPGYDDEVVMAAGTFVQGASIELSADGPLRDPFIAYFQGGLTYSHVKLASAKAILDMRRSGLL